MQNTEEPCWMLSPKMTFHRGTHRQWVLGEKGWTSLLTADALSSALLFCGLHVSMVSVSRGWCVKIWWQGNWGIWGMLSWENIIENRSTMFFLREQIWLGPWNFSGEGGMQSRRMVQKGTWREFGLYHIKKEHREMIKVYGELSLQTRSYFVKGKDHVLQFYLNIWSSFEYFALYRWTSEWFSPSSILTQVSYQSVGYY